MEFSTYSNCVINDIIGKLQVGKVGLFTKVKREENPKFVQTGQVCTQETLHPEGGVVWKIPYCIVFSFWPALALRSMPTIYMYCTHLQYVLLQNLNKLGKVAVNFWVVNNDTEASAF